MLRQVITFVGLDQPLQLSDEGSNQPATLTVSHSFRGLPLPHNGDVGDDVRTLVESGFDRFKMVMFGKKRPMRFQDQW